MGRMKDMWTDEQERLRLERDEDRDAQHTRDYNRWLDGLEAARGEDERMEGAYESPMGMDAWPEPAEVA